MATTGFSISDSIPKIGTIMSELSKEQQALDIVEVFRQASSDVIGVSRTIFDMVNDWNEAQILSELVYWTSPSKENKSKLKVVHDGYRWLACSRIEWWERRRLTVREVDRAIIRLIRKNLVVKHTYLFDGKTTLHIRLNVSEFLHQFMSLASSTYDEKELTNDDELLEAMALMGWGEKSERITKLVTPSYQNGNSINSNIHSNILNGEDVKNETKPRTLTDEDIEQFKQYSRTIGKAKPEKRVSKYSLSKNSFDDTDRMVYNSVRSFDKPKSNGQTKLPEKFKDQADWFMVHTGLSYVPKFRALWVEGFEEWESLGVIEEDVKKAVEKLQSAGFSIVSPGSLTKTLNGIVANRKKDSGSYNPWR